jgi:hypothetical protein
MEAAFITKHLLKPTSKQTNSKTDGIAENFSGFAENQLRLGSVGKLETMR